MVIDYNASSYEYATFPCQFLAYRWFKPLLIALLTIVFVTVFQMIIMAAGIAWLFAERGGMDADIAWSLSEVGSAGYFTGPGALIAFGSVASMLPALALATLIVRDRPLSSYSSSRGGFNWSAFFKCLGVGAVIYGALMALQIALFPDPNATGVVAFTAIGFVLVTVLVPIQAAAEEYVFRGFVLQTFGSWTRMPVVGIGVSSILFTIAHGYNLVGLVAIFIGAIIWGALAWYTRGLEATCAAHIVNNLTSIYVAGLGIMTTSSETDIASLVFALVIDVLYAAAIILLGKKFDWFAPKCDGTAKANEKYRAEVSAKRAAQLAQISTYTQRPQINWQLQIQPTRLVQPQDWQSWSGGQERRIQ